MIRHIIIPGRSALTALPGDPERASAIFMQGAESEQPPLHLYLEQDAYNRASGKLAAMNEELEEQKSITISADYN